MHLTGKLVAGVYPLLPDNTTWFLALDFDGAKAAQDAVAVFRQCRQRELPALLERSRSGNGFHVWLLFDKPIAAEKARKLGRYLIDSAKIGSKSFDRFFPSQDRHVGEKGLGNLIALPLQWEARQKGNTSFVDSESLEELPCPWAVLRQTARLSEDDLDLVLGESSRSMYVPLPLVRRHKASPIPSSESPGTINITLKEHVEVSLPCPSSIVDLLRKWSSFHNPDWYSKQKSGRYLGGTPQFIQIGGPAGDTWVLPRGAWPRLSAALAEANSKYEIHDERTAPAPLQWTTSFQLRPHQTEMVYLLLPHDEAVLEAPTGSGKTVSAMELMVRRQLPTLVLVHSRALLEQWVERAIEAFSIEKRKLGLVRRGRIKIGEHLTIATFQSLVRKDLGELADWCGHVVVDECHHVPAKTFASVMRRLKPKYLLGLTATAKRKDGLSRVIFDYLGPLIKTVTPRELDRKSVIVLPELVVHRTEFQHAEYTHIQELRNIVARDRGRNEQIRNDVLTAVDEGHLVLLLSDRKEHCDLLCDALRGRVGCATMYGTVGKKKRKLIFEEFESGNVPVLIATAALVGEGWDCPPLSALFLALPMGCSSRLTQLAGRLTRPDPEKPAPVLHDYFDQHVQVLTTMFHRRIKAFRRLLGDERLPAEFRVQSKGNRADLEYGPKRAGKGRKSKVREAAGQLYLFE
jgi:superfamily II DNA or RNA helicase